MAALALLVRVLSLRHPAQPRPALWLSLVAFAFLFPPLAANFHEDQAIIFFFGLFIVVLWGLVKQREAIAGAALGLALILKTTGLSLWWLLLLQRRWRALIWGVGTAAVVALATLPWIGLDTWLVYLRAAGSVTGGPVKAITAYQTSAGFFTHLFVYDPTWNPYPLFHWPTGALLLSTIVTLAALGLTLWWGRRAETGDLFAALLPLSVILLPVAEAHHFVILLIPIFWLVDSLADLPLATAFFSTDGLLLGLALLLLIAPIPYEALSFRPGAWMFLAYPRLYGGWLLWGVAVRRMWEKAKLQRI